VRFESSWGASPAVIACSLAKGTCVPRASPAREKDSRRREEKFIAAYADVCPPKRVDGETGVSPVSCRFAKVGRDSPVAKEESYFAQPIKQGSGPCRGAEFQRRGRSPEAQGSWKDRPRTLFERSPARMLVLECSRNKSRPVVKTRVTSLDTRVVAGSNPAAGIGARVAQWKSTLCP